MATSRTVSAKNKKVGMRDGAFGGFTIIEVVLVLAIAGLIFLMVFIALPQLQRAQRDTQRREDMGRLASAVTQFQTNNNGKIPGQTSGTTLPITCEGSGVVPNNMTSTAGDACRLIGVYMNSAASSENTFVDPDGSFYDLTISNDPAALDSAKYGDHKIYMIIGAKCSGETVTKEGAQPRDYAIVYKLEGSGTYCGGSNN